MIGLSEKTRQRLREIMTPKHMLVIDPCAFVRRVFSELKPCPFCDGAPRMRVQIVTKIELPADFKPESELAAELIAADLVDVDFVPECVSCGAQIRAGSGFATRQLARKAWNRRAG